MQRRFAALAALPPTHPAFSLPAYVLRAMTTAAEPLPLMWGDAIATLANVRVDESPLQNVQVRIDGGSSSRVPGGRAVFLNHRLTACPHSHPLQTITIASALIDASWNKYCRERAAWLDTQQQQPPRGGVAAEEAAALAAERPVLQAGMRAMLPLEDLLPVFSFAVVRACVDRPMLCAALAGAWLQQQGLTSSRDGFALSLFKAACLWAAALPAVPAT